MTSLPALLSEHRQRPSIIKNEMYCMSALECKTGGDRLQVFGGSLDLGLYEVPVIVH